MIDSLSSPFYANVIICNVTKLGIYFTHRLAEHVLLSSETQSTLILQPQSNHFHYVVLNYKLTVITNNSNQHVFIDMLSSTKRRILESC